MSDLSGELMNSTHKARRSVQRGPGESTILSSLERLRQLRSIKYPHIKGKQDQPKRLHSGIPHGSVPCDLDRVAQADSELEVLGILNQVLQVMHRTGRMADVPPELRVDCLTTSQELQMAVRRMRAGCAFGREVHDSDALFVLRVVLTAAHERLTELRGRE
jgi:hypothetical protein